MVSLDEKITNKERREIVGNLITVLDLVPEKTLDAIMEHLESGEEMTPIHLKKIAGLSDQKLESLMLLLDNKKVSHETLLLSLDVAMTILKRTEKERESIDLSWTGPIQFSVEGRSTQSLVEEMIKNAKQSIVITGYSITEETGILELLESAMERGVEVTMIVHMDDENKNIRVLSKMWPSPPRPTIYSRERGKDDIYFKIHAKMIVVDSADLLVTSANLTYHGMSNNFEVGVRIRGNTARKAHMLVDELVKSKYLEEKTW